MLKLKRGISNIFKPIEALPVDKILHFVEVFKNDSHPNKVNLTVGAYRDEEGKPWVLPSVKKALQEVINNLNCEYLPIPGDPEFILESLKLAYGTENGKLAGIFEPQQIAAIQTLSGTGAIFLAFSFLKQYYNFSSKVVYLPIPSWPIYKPLLERLEFVVHPITYYDEQKRNWNFDIFAEEVAKIPSSSILILQASGHNPTGIDLDAHQWKQIIYLCKKNNLTVLLDMAYQGFVSGDASVDALAVRLFVQSDVPILLCQSYAKNFGLYGQRVGCLSIPMESHTKARIASDHLAYFIRHTYSNNPRMGSDIVKTILRSPSLTAQWHLDIKHMATRLNTIRQTLVNELRFFSGENTWDYIGAQRGMFSFTHLTLSQVQRLRKEKGIHLIDSGRISLCGLNSKNVKYVAEIFHEITQR